MRKHLLQILSIALLGTAAATAQDAKPADDFKFVGQAIMRTEFDGRDFNNKTYMPNASVSRLRFGVEKGIYKDVTGVFQVQDSRLIGNSDASLNKFFVQSAYLKFDNFLTDGLWLQIGRFPVDYGSRRWIGSSGWTYDVSGTKDGLRLGYKADKMIIDGFATLAKSNAAYIKKGNPASYPSYTATESMKSSVCGLWGHFILTRSHDFGVLIMNEADGSIDMMRNTIGVDYNYKYNDFSANVNAAYQFGSLTEDVDIAAYDLNLQAAYDFKPVKLALAFGMTSGAEAGDDKYKNFTYAQGAMHNHFGLMDYFPSTFDGTINPGLNDIKFTIDYRPEGSKCYLIGDFHYFMAATDYTMKNGETSKSLGEEIDLRLGYKFMPKTTLEFGACAFLPSDLMKDRFEVVTANGYLKREDTSFWSYLQLRIDL